MSERRSSEAGALVLVVGPSGAGKDSLIGAARTMLAGEPAFDFPLRLITRASDATEDCRTLTRAEFAQGRAKCAFALHWEAHGQGYALDRDILAAIERGAVVVANVSRQVIAPARRIASNVFVVHVTVDADTLAERLRARGRDSDIESRLIRADLALQDAPDLEIVNDGPLQQSAETLVAFLRAVASAPRR